MFYMKVIDIIVPVYNVERFLDICVKRILNQSYQNFELILINDGSTDSCAKICDEFARIDPRVKVIHKHNEGVSVARNIGLSYATAQYVTFCDADDFWERDHLEKLLKSINDSDADVAVSNFNIVNTNSQVIDKAKHLIGEVVFLTNCDILKALFDMLTKYALGWEVWTRIFKTDIIKNNKIHFPTTCKNYAEDLAFVFTYSFYTKKIISVDSATYNYRIRDNSMMRTSENVAKLDEMNEVSFWLYPRFREFFKKNKEIKYFPIFHFLILYIELRKFIFSDKYRFLPDYINNLEHSEHFISMAKKLKRRKRLLTKLFGKTNSQKIVLFSHFCVHRNWKRFGYESAFAYRFFIKGE